MTTSDDIKKPPSPARHRRTIQEHYPPLPRLSTAREKPVFARSIDARSETVEIEIVAIDKFTDAGGLIRPGGSFKVQVETQGRNCLGANGARGDSRRSGERHMPWLATIGYEDATLEDFLATLAAAGVTTLIDIRQVATSRRAGFSKQRLRQAVCDAGMRYVHLVRLGDPKEGRNAARQGRMAEFRQIFTRHLRTAEAQSDLRIAADLVREGGGCLLCYERQPEFCHRSIVADALTATTGIDVRHLGVRGGLAKDDGDERSRARPGASQGIAACR